MAETTNLKLYTEDGGSVTFQEWRKKVAGETNSNMTKLDEAVAGKQDKFSPDSTLTLKDGVLGVSFPNKAITRAEYDALPEEEKMAEVNYIITDDGSESGVSLYEQFKERGYTGTENEFNALISSGPWVPLSGGTLTGAVKWGNAALMHDYFSDTLTCVVADETDYASPGYAPFACGDPTDTAHAATKG